MIGLSYMKDISQILLSEKDHLFEIKNAHSDNNLFDDLSSL